MEAVQIFGGNGYMTEYRVEATRARREVTDDLRG